MKSLIPALILATSVANAELIQGLTIESATVGLNPQMGPEKAINGFGLDGDTPSLTASHRQGFDTNWWSGWDGAITDWQLTVDLEGNYKLDTIHIWNYREACCTSRGLNIVEIYVSPDENEDNLVKLVTDGSGTHDNDSGGFSFPQGPVGGDYFGFDLDVSGVTNVDLLLNARLVRIDGGSSLHVGAEVHGGLAEIQFDGSAPVENSAPLQLSIAEVGGTLEFSWTSTEGKVYDLVSSTDLSTPIAEWPVYETNQNIAATVPTNILSEVTLDVPKRFFALVEKNSENSG